MTWPANRLGPFLDPLLGSQYPMLLRVLSAGGDARARRSDIEAQEPEGECLPHAACARAHDMRRQASV